MSCARMVWVILQAKVKCRRSSQLCRLTAVADLFLYGIAGLEFDEFIDSLAVNARSLLPDTKADLCRHMYLRLC